MPSQKDERTPIPKRSDWPVIFAWLVLLAITIIAAIEALRMMKQ